MPFTSKTDNLGLHYELTGRKTGPPVLLIQGLGADKNSWMLQRFAMATRFCTITFDYRGIGQSQKPTSTYSLEQMADDAISVLDAAGVGDAHIVGASMGGVISQIIAVKYPQRVRSLTLACTACRNHPWREDLLQHWADTAKHKGMVAVGRKSAKWVMSPRSLRRLVTMLGWLAPVSVSRPSQTFVDQVDALLSTNESIVDQLSSISAPTLVIVGNQDILTPRGDSEELAERIANAELVVISGAAHGLMVEHASTFNQVLIEFLQRVEKTRAQRQHNSDTLVS